MKYMHRTLIAASLMLIVTPPLFAGHSHRDDYCDYNKIQKIEKRLGRQHNRIERGIERDRLTRGEARELKKRFRRISRLSREYREDGYLSRREYRKLNQNLDKSSHLIDEYTHNRIDRYIAYHDEYSPTGYDRYRRD